MNQNDILDTENNLKPINSDESENEEKLNKIKLYVVIVIKVILSIISFGLTWDCSKNSNVFLKLIYGIIAIIFSEFYILYYAIYRICMGNKCPV